MTYDYNSKIYLAEAVLNVKDLAGQTAFYSQILKSSPKRKQKLSWELETSPWST